MKIPEITVESATTAHPITPANPYIIVVALIVALGGFLLGFDATVISGAQPFLQKYFHLDDLDVGWAVSALQWGALAGYAVAGPLSDRFGRKIILIVTAVLFAVSASLSALTTNYTLFVVSRIIGGIALGGPLLVAPVYIAEIAPSNLRGMLVSFNQLNIVVGISASFFSNYFLLNTGANNWRWMLGVEAAPAVLYFILLFWVPESPRWLFGGGMAEAARKIFARVGGDNYADGELRGLRVAGSSERRQTEPLLKRLSGLFSRRMSFVLFIALTIAFFQQITGINAIFYYLPTIFAQAGNGLELAFQQAALVGVVNFCLTLVAMWLIDLLGRRPLLLIGAAGMTIALLTCAWAFHDAHYELSGPAFARMEKSHLPSALIGQLRTAGNVTGADTAGFIAALKKQLPTVDLESNRDAIAGAALNIRASVVMFAIMAFVASFAISLGPVMWVLLSEIFPLEHRGMAISLAGFWNGLVSATVTLIFPWELSRFGPAGTFLGYGLFALLAVVFVALFIPETKRKTLEELECTLLRSEI